MKEACELVGLSRSTYYYKLKHRESNVRKEYKSFDEDDLLEKIKNILLEHPFWGYRRVCAFLRNRMSLEINQKKVRRIMNKYSLLQEKKFYKAKRKPHTSKPRATKPNEIWGIDMTKLKLQNGGWIYLVIVLDWYSKKIVGYDISLRSKTEDWLRAIDMAVNNELPSGCREYNLKLVSDNVCQPTSRSFMNATSLLNIEQVFTSYNNPKGNADTERMMRTIKEEVVWINEFDSYKEACDTISLWIEKEYNKFYLHSSLDYTSPDEYLRKYYKNSEGHAA